MRQVHQRAAWKLQWHFQVNGVGGVGLATVDSEVFSVAVTVASNDLMFKYRGLII